MAVTYGIHAVTQALEAGRAAERLLVLRGKKGAAIDKVVRAAKQANIPVRFVTKSELDREADSGVHQGVALIGGGKRYLDLEDLLAQVAEKKSALLVLLDGVQDPHNLGAILRTAVCAGADGVILPERRSAGITPAAEKLPLAPLTTSPSPGW
jgi:23S rRNA (guanosine2251-2'-O)-methyltransferase